MPIYEYECSKGHRFERMQSVGDDDKLMQCIYCKQKALRVFPLPSPGIVKGTDTPIKR